ncbi:pyridoxamine 5'-phosphate oxidase family protein [Aldersonia sp. NBC_00410]|uniref:pyridoxamine 5'-phosphate oxidase family protein n=1 Tax=Aldersonia sp. NBC_00410 TaxID=2975954 RepID=UPI002252D434|nr:pyridoxamine 5'-phosphate oxidase family protein [Aldersonia sp. NBC_00410]MCX5041995.1 pyridoxamine 5'-phosphate oxidase family protein [Aldersonia sp. NBC_00410]
MATWNEFVAEAPQLAEAIEARLKAHKHHLLATLRRDGSPRISGTEVEFFEGQLVIGSMLNALKVRDISRDPRYALHANPGHHSMEGGDAKVSGRAREVHGEEKDRIVANYEHDPGEAHFVVLDIDEAVLTTVDEAREHLNIDLWRPGAEVQRFFK